MPSIIHRFRPNPTAIGSFAVLVWGMSLAFNRLVASYIGVPALIGTVFTVTGVMGLINQRRMRQPKPTREIFKNPLVYVRWVAFALNPLCVWTAVAIVQKQHMPLVILINYIWPTAIILFSILIAGVKITRKPFFIVGTLIVIVALSIEIVQPGMLGPGLFAAAMDRLAYGLALISALSWSFYTALTRHIGHQTGGAVLIPYFQLTLGLALPVSFLPGIYRWDHLTIGIAALLAAWCVLQFFAFLTWDYGTRKGNVVILSLCADFIPWLSLAVSHVLLGVEIGNKTIVSALLLVAGAMITRYGTLTKRMEKQQLEELAHEHSPSN